MLSRFGFSPLRSVGPKDSLAGGFEQEINATVFDSKATASDITGGATTWIGPPRKAWKKIGIMRLHSMMEPPVVSGTTERWSHPTNQQKVYTTHKWKTRVLESLPKAEVTNFSPACSTMFGFIIAHYFTNGSNAWLMVKSRSKLASYWGCCKGQIIC